MAKTSKRRDHYDEWERHPFEPVQAFHGFSHFRDSNNRSLASTARFLNVPLSRVHVWCKKYEWESRALAWDHEQDRQCRKNNTIEVSRMRQRHTHMAVAMQGAVQEEFKAHLALIADAAKKAKQTGRPRKPYWAVRDIVAIHDHAIHLERISRGEPTEHIQLEPSETPRDLSKLTKEELAWYRRCLKKMASEGVDF